MGTVYIFEFAQSYFRLLDILDWFAPSRIRPLSNFLIWNIIHNSISQVLNSPSSQRAKRAKKGFKMFIHIHMLKLYNFDRDNLEVVNFISYQMILKIFSLFTFLRKVYPKE